MAGYFLSIRGFFAVATVTMAIVATGCGGSGDTQGGAGSQGSSSSASTASQEPGSTQEGGGEEGEATVQTGSLSKAAFIKQASAICRTTKEKAQAEYLAYVQRNNVPSSGPGVAVKAADLIDSVIAPIYQSQIDQIKGLGAPSGDEEEVAAILNAMQRGIEEGRQQPLQFIRGGPFLQEASQLAQAYGVPTCAG